MIQIADLFGARRRLIAVLLPFSVLAGCAGGMSREECEVVDWRALGYEDGVKGWSEARIGDHRKACAKHGIGLDLDAYRSGWREGVQSYCSPGNGYKLGRRGQRYSGVCPGELEPAFLTAFRDGRELYDQEAEVRRLAHRLDNTHKRLAQIDGEMRDTGLELVAPGIPTERRVVLLDDLRKLGDERAAAKSDIPALEAELEYQKQQLEVISARHQY
jgi:hypothetical protein